VLGNIQDIDRLPLMILRALGGQLPCSHIMAAKQLLNKSEYRQQPGEHCLSHLSLRFRNIPLSRGMILGGRKQDVQSPPGKRSSDLH
jgi:hypothetical protein